MKTLIADDMKEVYDVLREIYPNSVYSPNPKDAIEKIRTEKFEKVITDYDFGKDFPEGGVEIIEEASKKGLDCVLMSTENHIEEASRFNASFIFKKELLKNAKR